MDNRKHASLVLPLIDENKPKCYLCHELFESMEGLKTHLGSKHKEFLDKYEKDHVEI